MPREIAILSPVAPDIRVLLEAGAAVDGTLGLRTLRGGAVHQLCRETPEGNRAVLSLDQPLTVENVDEVRRLLPAARVATLTTPLWWVEALAPWGELGRTGVAIAQELAARLGAVCVVQDGE